MTATSIPREPGVLELKPKVRTSLQGPGARQERLSLAGARLGIAGVLLLLLPGCAAAGPGPAAVNRQTPAGEVVAPSSSANADYRAGTQAGPAENVRVPELPDLASAESKSGAVAFGRYWFSVLNYARETGDAAPLRGASSACAHCLEIADDLTRLYANGGWLVGGKVTIPAISTTFAKGKDGSYQVAAQVWRQPGTVMSRDGSVEKEYARTKTANIFDS